MIAKQLLSALAVAGFTAAQDPCTSETFTINSQADFRQYTTCRTLKGNVVIGTNTDPLLDFGSIQSVEGSVTLKNNGLVTSLKGDFLSSITGDFVLQNLTALASLGFRSLKSVGTINWVSLTAIDQLSFSTGITSAKSVVISDTFLSSLDGLNMQSVANLDINNNRRLVRWSSQLANLTDKMNINANGLNLQVSLPNLVRVANMTISNVSSFDIPSLSTVEGNIQFFYNFFTSFSAPNLTSTRSGDISFVSNGQLANITFPQLDSIGGGFLIANNTGLRTINGFPKLKTVGGAIKLRGSFNSVSYPALNDVKGAFDCASTNEITASCATFQSLKSGGQIQGDFNCTGNVSTANQDTSAGGNGGGGNGGKNSAAGLAINMVGILGLTVLGIAFQAML